MAALLDTSVLVRYLTSDPPQSAAEAAELVEGEERLLIASVTLAETAFTLTSFYRADRAVCVDALIDLLRRDNIAMLDLTTELAVEALMLSRPSKRVSFADALEWAAARHSGTTTVYTFDRSFPVQGIDRRILGY